MVLPAPTCRKGARMSPSRRVRIRTLCLGLILCAAGLAAAAEARAQPYDDALRFLDLTPDPLARSPRLKGMGSLSLVVDDPHNRITLWDFAGSPAGILSSDSTSTFDLRPVTGSASSVRDAQSAAGPIERQSLAAR